jgi:archaemetzincin
VLNKKLVIFLGFVIFGAIAAWLLLRLYIQQAEDSVYDFRIPEQFARLQPLFIKPKKPQAGEWLERHLELGQTYQEYVQFMRIYAQRPVPPRNVIYVQPLGNFSADQRKTLDKTAEFLGVYFGLPVQMLDARPLPPIPDRSRRNHDSPHGEQILTNYLLYEVLKPEKPDDAYILIGFVAGDISPFGSWNYVFGQAAVKDRIAICSLARFCSDNKLSDNPTLCLRRTLKISAHEIGHLFSLAHCTWYLCNMAGSNSLQELDRHPLELCPHCMAKICHITGVDPLQRIKNLRSFYAQNGLDEEKNFCDQLLSRW